MRTVRALVVGIVAAIAACGAGCSSSEGGVESESLRFSGNGSGPLSLAFDHAAEQASVPRDLLVAIARVEDGLGLPAQRLQIEEANEVPAAGPLMLRRGKLDTLARGAALIGHSELALRRHTDLALDAGALVLAELGVKTGARHGDLASWKTALEEMSGYADEDHRDDYAHRVFATLARGGRLEARDGEIIALPQHDLPPTLTLDISMRLHTLAVSQYPGAQWIPTSCNNKCTAGRGGAKVEYIVIHDTEGGWDASVSTLQNDPQKSVQYIVGTDGRVAQFVTEDTTAWHAGNYYFNQRSIGIEHVGYSTKPYTEAEYAASAKLVDHLTKKYGVARDRAHIIGHEQIPNGTKIAQSAAPCSTSPKTCQSNVNYGGAGHHTDPGVWEWPTYMKRFGAESKCNDVTALWNCSNDKKKAFRCAGGKVTVEGCDGAGACEVKAIGQDDVCHTSPKPPGTPPAPTTDPGSSTPSGGPSIPGAGTAAEPTETTGAAAALAPGDDADSSADADAGGCAVGAGSRSSAPLGLLLLAAASVFASIRRRRALAVK